MATKPARKPTSLEIVAAAYDLRKDLPSWFAGCVSLFRAHMDDGHGAYGAIVRRAPPKMFHLHLDGAHPINRSVLRLGPSLGFYDAVPERFSAGTATEYLGEARHARVVAPFRRFLSARDSCAIWGPDAAGLMIVVAAPRKEAGPPWGHDRHLAHKLLPHFTAGLRLRRSLTGLSLETASVEAIFSTDGRCVNAQGMAEPANAREGLRRAVIDMEAARARPASETDSPRAALLDGRWSLVDRFDTDGRRFVVAYRNPPGVLDPRRLSRRERDVAARLAQGMSQGAVAAELGIQSSTVATVASTVIGKLGLHSTRALPLFWRDSGGDPVALGRDDLVAISSAAGPARPRSELTPAEREVLDGVIHGHSNRQIANQRGTSIHTVANQIAALLKKLCAGSRSELSAKVLDR